MILLEKSLLLFFSIFSFKYCTGQNLIPNSSFEDTLGCPTYFSQLNLSSGWLSFRETPDCFNTCSNSGWGVPINFFGYQLPHSGNSYGGFLGWSGDHREIMGIKLTDTLQIGKKYYVSFYVSLGIRDSGSYQIEIAQNKIGAKFCTKEYSISNPIPIDNYSQIYSDVIISDTLNWVKIAGSFIADSQYVYIALGCFYQTSQIQLNYFQFNGNRSYYYIDDICVSTDSTFCNPQIQSDTELPVISIPNVFTPNDDYINDEFFPIIFKNIKTSHVSIYDRWGSLIFKSNEINWKWGGIFNGKKCNSGVYFWLINYTSINNKSYTLRGYVELIN